MSDDSQEHCKCDQVASTVEPVIEVGEVKKRRRQRDEHRGAGARSSAIREQVTDLAMAKREIEEAIVEMEQVPELLHKYQRHKVTLEPMSRLLLVRRFIDGVLKRNGYGT